MKGQTQAVGAILLMGITVTAVAAVSSQVFGVVNSQNAEQAVPDANPGKLRVMSCWVGNYQVKMSIRNGQRQKLNTSKLSIVVNGSTEDFEASQTIIGPQKTFQLGVKELFTENALTKVVAGNGKSARLSCRGIEPSELFSYYTSFEGNDPSWNCYSTNYEPSTCTTDATDYHTDGSESVKVKHEKGLCGYGGQNRSFNPSGAYRTLTLDAKVKTGDWGRATIMVKNSSGVYAIKRWKGAAVDGGVNKNWQTYNLDISGSGDSFSIILGNDDNTGPCNNGDHRFTLWVDNLEVH